MTAASLLGLSGYALVAAALMATLLRGRGTLQFVLVLVAAAVLFLPYGGLPIAAYARGAFGDFSVTTMVLLVSALVAALGGPPLFDRREYRVLLAVTAVTGLVLYPLALGFGGFDPYAAGYDSVLPLGFLGLAVLAAWFARWHGVVAIGTLAVAGQLAGALDSQNLWDYVIDPLVWVYALGWWGVRLVRGGLSAYR